MDAFVPDNAFFSDLFPAGLKLRFDKAHKLSAVLEQRAHSRKNKLNRYERQIHNGHVDRLGYLIRANVPYIGALHVYNTHVLPETPRKLTVSHIDRIHFFCPVLQENISKSTGGRTAVDADLILRIHRKDLECLFELEASPADVRERSPLYFNVCGR